MLLEVVTCLLLVAQETRTETWPGGSKRCEYAVGPDEHGELVRHGPYRAWYEDGTLEVEGEYHRGEEHGLWTRYHPNGQVRSRGRYADALESGPWETWYPDGQRESKGSYVRGARKGRWTYWREDGTKDLLASGLHELVVYRSDDGRAYRGYLVDNLRQGPWTATWPDGSLQLEGRFEEGARSGPWIFHHRDGTPSSLLLTGSYVDGRWAGPLELPPAPPLDPTALGTLEPAPGGWPDEREALRAALRAALDGEELLDAELAERLARARTAAIPVALEVLRELDPETPSGRARIGRLDRLVLRPLCAGHSLTRSGPDDAATARELVRAWGSLWAVTRADRRFWDEVVPGPTPAGGGLRDLLQDPPLLERDPAFEPAAAEAPVAAASDDPPPVRAPYRLRFGREKEEAHRYAPAGTAECIERALAWLAGHQRADGSWSNGGFAEECGRVGRGTCEGAGHPAYDVGATGLALLALMGDGNTPHVGPYQESVTRGLDWLLSRQGSDGLIGERVSHDFIYGHAIATQALSEGYGLGAEALRVPAERALAFLQLGRHPQGGWRYDVPATELGDTSVTGWAVNALVAARRAGLAFDPGALEGALAWIERMSEPRTGRVGYTTRGETSVRTTENDHFPRDRGEPLTAIGLQCRLLLGQELAGNPMLVAHARLLAAKPPRIEQQFGGDQYYWYHGTNALHEYGAPFWDAWEVELRKTVILTQVRRGDAEGSWDPIGPWGAPMGRLTATALMALTLECFQRYPRALE